MFNDGSNWSGQLGRRHEDIDLPVGEITYQNKVPTTPSIRLLLSQIPIESSLYSLSLFFLRESREAMAKKGGKGSMILELLCVPCMNVARLSSCMCELPASYTRVIGPFPFLRTCCLLLGFQLPRTCRGRKSPDRQAIVYEIHTLSRITRPRFIVSTRRDLAHSVTLKRAHVCACKV